MADYQKLYDELTAGSLKGLDDAAVADALNGARNIPVKVSRPVTYAVLSKLLGPVQAKAFAGWCDANSADLRGAFTDVAAEPTDSAGDDFQAAVAAALVAKVITANEAGMLRDLGGYSINLGETFRLEEPTPELVAAVRTNWPKLQARVDEAQQQYQAAVDYAEAWKRNPVGKSVPDDVAAFVDVAVAAQEAKP